MKRMAKCAHKRDTEEAMETDADTRPEGDGAEDLGFVGEDYHAVPYNYKREAPDADAQNQLKSELKKDIYDINPDLVDGITSTKEIDSKDDVKKSIKGERHWNTDCVGLFSLICVLCCAQASLQESTRGRRRA